MKKILICDDDESIVEVIKIILESENFETATCNSGKGIERKVMEYNPDLIFLDIWMPGIDGKEVTKILKKNPKTSGIPVIVISALNDTKDVAQEAGADGFLSKPFEMEELISTAKKYTTDK